MCQGFSVRKKHWTRLEVGDERNHMMGVRIMLVGGAGRELGGSGRKAELNEVGRELTQS
jgi:hypothetical protein